jgi:hypothetical protein
MARRASAWSVWGMWMVAIAACTPTEAATDGGRIVMMDAPLSCHAPGSVPDGGRCRCVSDCADGVPCVNEAGSGFAGGICARSCATEACPAGYTCTGAMSRYCALNCASTADCGPARVCADGLCKPWCTEDAECDSGNCNEYSGYCLDAGETPAGTAGLWDPCLRDEDCISDLCSNAYHICISACSISEQSCPEGGVCSGSSSDPSADWGQCLVACGTDGSCPTDSECLDREVPPGSRACTFPATCTTGDGSLADGASCTCNGDCASGSCYTEEDYGAPGGFCYHACTSDGDCTGGARCSGEFCTPGCTAGGGECRVGWVCDGVCRPLCQADSDCSTYDTCDLYTGLCGLTTTGAGVGAACASGDDCRSGYCNTGGWTEGYCVSNCSVMAQACPENAYCRPRTTGTTDLGICAPLCTSMADCGPSSVCASVGGSPMHCF